MNYNVIQQMLENGISEDEIMSSLIKNIPNLAKKASRMFSGGWKTKDVLDIFMKDKDVQKKVSRGLKPTTPSEIAAYKLQQSYNNIPQSAGQQSKEELQDFTKKAAPIALGAIAAPMAATALQRALPTNLKSMMPSLLQGSQQSQGMPQVFPQTGATTSQNVNQETPQQPPTPVVQDVASVTQTQQITQPEVIPIDPNQVRQEANALWARIQKGVIKHPDKDLDAFLKITNDLTKYSGLNREGFDKLYNDFLTKKQSGMPLDQIAKDMFASGGKSKELPHSVPEEKNGDVIAQERKPIAKSETVATPHGVGEVKEIRNGKAIVEVDGKKHQVNEDELETAPIPEKDLAALYDELIQGIEGETGEDVSRMVQWAGYNPETNTLQFLPHTGKLYKYGNISPEDAALLTDILSTRKTSGENFIGAWKAGSKSPIGAALSKLIRKLQTERGGKGNEYEETHEPIYSAYEPAVQAAKKKKKKK